MPLKGIRLIKTIVSSVREVITKVEINSDLQGLQFEVF